MRWDTDCTDYYVNSAKLVTCYPIPAVTAWLETSIFVICGIRGLLNLKFRVLFTLCIRFIHLNCGNCAKQHTSVNPFRMLVMWCEMSHLIFFFFYFAGSHHCSVSIICLHFAYYTLEVWVEYDFHRKCLQTLTSNRRQSISDYWIARS